MQGAGVGTPPVFNGQQQTLTINGLGRLNEAASFGEIIIRRGAQGQLVRLADATLSWAPAATARRPAER